MYVILVKGEMEERGLGGRRRREERERVKGRGGERKQERGRETEKLSVRVFPSRPLGDHEDAGG